MANLRTGVRAMALGVCLSVALASCRSLPGPEETTTDGLVRVPSRKAGGVYRAPGVSFERYSKFIVEPLTVEFVEGWRKQHKEVSDKEIRRMREEAARIFIEEFRKDLVEEGGYTMAESPGADVLLLAPALTELDLPAPDSESVDTRTLSPRRPSMTMTGELRDSVSGKLIGRVIYIAPGESYGFNELRLANRVTNAHETRLVYAEWVRLLREALNVAKTERPREDAPRGEK